jgi:phage terminase large subunit
VGAPEPYVTALAERAEKLLRLRAKPESWAALRVFYRDNPVEFINDWGVTFDPRNAEVGLPAVLPFSLFPKQVEYIQWLHARWKGREDGLVEKSRDMGASWLCVAFAVWLWSFYAQSVAGFGSRKEEYVDASGDPKSLFWKIREFIDYLPVELRPRGYERSRHANYMRIVNPENEAVIVGEAGDNIGRGNRTSIYFKDESAFYERPELIDAALSQTSNCKIDVSTPNGNGNPFYRKRHAGKVPVFTLHWRDDPRKGDEWYAKQRDKLDPVILAQEVDIDYNASTSDSYISGKLIEAAQGVGPADVEVNGPWMVGVDAAHMGDDENVIHARRGSLNLEQAIGTKLDGVQLAAAVEEKCRTLEESAPIGAIVIELDGPGVSCYDQLKGGKYADKVVGVHTGTRLSDDRNYNLKAKLWRRALDYLTEGKRSMPRDPELKTQIAAVRYSYKDGLLLMEPKKEHKKRLGRSPDRADAWILTFADLPKVIRLNVQPIPVKNYWSKPTAGARLGR